jgi:Co/Zn/Cd efflux system component
MYITIIASFAIVECMIGLSHTNVHIVRDSLNVFLMLSALVFSSKALQLSQKPKDEDYPFGYRRFNVLAAFVNSVYLLFSFVFSFVDNLHHMVEHWEVDQNSSLPSSHDDISHIKEVNSYLTLFTFLKMCILGAYLYFESR